MRKLAGAEIGRTLDDDAVAALGEAVRGELDYRAEAAAQQKFATAWAGDKTLRIPRVIESLSSARVLTMTRARGKSVVEIAAGGAPDVRAQAALAIYKFAWGSPLAHKLLNADPNPGNFLVDEQPDGHVLVWCLDFGCAIELPDDVRDADRELWWGLLDDDNEKAAERFRMALARSGLLKRTDTMATNAHREWERVARRTARHARRVPLVRRVRRRLRGDHGPRARRRWHAPAREAAAALAPAPRRRGRDRHARRAGAVSTRPARPHRQRPPRAALSPRIAADLSLHPNARPRRIDLG